jgi:hypothetical protein
LQPGTTYGGSEGLRKPFKIKSLRFNTTFGRSGAMISRLAFALHCFTFTIHTVASLSTFTLSHCLVLFS